MTHAQVKSKKVLNSLNFNELHKPFKNVPGEDITAPDQSMSLREMLTRYSRGLPLEDSGHSVFYDEEDDDNTSQIGINPKTLDLVDIENMKLENQQRVLDLDTELKNQISTGKKEKQEKDAQKAEKEAMVDRLLYGHDPEKKKEDKKDNKSDDKN